MTVEQEVRSGLIVPHRFVGRPVVLRTVDRSLGDRRIHIVGSDTGNTVGSEQLDHPDHHLVVLHTDLQACHVGQTLDRLLRIEVSRTRVIVGETDQAGAGGLDIGKQPLSDFTVENLPHVFAVTVQIRHLQRIDLRHIGSDRGSGNTGESEISDLQRFDGAGLLPVQRTAGIDLDLDSAVRPLLDQTGEFSVGQRGRIPFGMDF